MYVHPIDYAELRKHAATIEAKYPIKILGVLPRGSVARGEEAGIVASGSLRSRN